MVSGKPCGTGIFGLNVGMKEKYFCLFVFNLLPMKIWLKCSKDD